MTCTPNCCVTKFSFMCLENPQNTHTHTLTLSSWGTSFKSQLVVIRPSRPHTMEMDQCQQLTPMKQQEGAIACHRLIGWSATFGDSSEACLSCQKTRKDKPKTQSQKVTNQKPKPTSATSQCQIKKLFRRGSKRGTLHSGWNLHAATCTLLWQACCHHAVPSLKTLATCPELLRPFVLQMDLHSDSVGVRQVLLHLLSQLPPNRHPRHLQKQGWFCLLLLNGKLTLFSEKRQVGSFEDSM